MTGTSTAAIGRLLSSRAFILAGTALTAVILPAIAHAQNIASSGSSSYSLAETATRSGGPRVVDIANSGGDIGLDLGTIEAANPGNTFGAGVAASNTGSGNVTIKVAAVTASGSGSTYGVDARSAGGAISITSGTVTSDSNASSRGIYAISANGDITINADMTTGAQRAIYTGANNGVFPNSTTITSNVAVANGTNSPNAIIGQGNAVSITSGIARNSNVDATTGTAIFANSGTGGAIIRATTTEALGNNQAGIWAYSDGAVQIDSGTIGITQTSYGINIQGATTLDIRSGTVNSTGSYGATGIYVSNILSSAAITSAAIHTAGSQSYGIWFDRSAGDITIDSAAITTLGDNSAAINIAGATGTTHITTGTINTAGQFSHGMTVDSTGAVRIDSTSIVTTGQYSEGMMLGSSGSLTINSDTISATGLSSGAIYARSSGAIDVTSKSATSGEGSLGIYLSNRGAAGALDLKSGDVRGAKNAIAAYGQDATTVTSEKIVLAGPSTASSPGYGISARSASGAVSVTSGTIEGLSNGTSYGIDARAGGTSAVSIRSGAISAFGDGGFGIHGVTDAGALTIVSTGPITTTGTTAYDLIDSGAVQPSAAPRENHSAHGIWAASAAGAIAITNSSSIATSGALAHGITAQSTTGAVTVVSDMVHTSGLGAQGIWAQTTSGDILIRAGTTVTTAAGYHGASGGTQDGVFGYSSGAGAVTVFSDYASTLGDFGNTVGAVGGGTINITSGTAIGGGVQTATIYGRSRSSDVTITSVDALATGINAYAVEGHADNGNLTIISGITSAQHGNAVYGVAGGLVTVSATTANAFGDGGTGVAVTGGAGVALTIGSASSNGTTVTNAQTGITYRADAVFAEATNGAITATIGSAIATGAGSDAVHLIANGTGGAVTATITGTVSATSGTGLWIDPPGAVNVAIGAGGSVSGGTNAINLTGGTNNLTNLGAITSTGGVAILASGPTLLDNSGTIAGASGSAAVQLGASNDIVILRSGSSVTGAILGGGGTDAAVLAAASGSTAPTAMASFTGFDSLNVQGGYWTAPTTATSRFNSVAIAGGGTLELANGNSGITGVAVPTIVADGTLAIRSGSDAGADVFGATTVTGAGGVRFTGTGTAVLAGNNSLQNSGVNLVDSGAHVIVTGTEDGSFINNGVFQIGTGGTTGSFTGNLVDNGTLIVDRSDAYRFDGVLSGSGIFVKQGAGTITFGAGYAFTGTTQLDGGAIKLSGTVAATTQLAVEGTGTVDFSGTNQAVAELAGTSSAASVNIAGGSLAVNQSSNTSFAGALTGAGSFTKAGTGTLTLSGANSYTGPTVVNGGELAVNGSIVSPLTVNAGGTLSGTGSLGNTMIGAGGSWAPGAAAATPAAAASRMSSGISALAIRAAAVATPSFATQVVNGNVTFAKGSIFAVDVDAAGHTDRVSATGTVTIAGGTVQVAAGAGTYAPLSTYTIVTAAGGVNGRFDAVTTDLAFLTPLLSYGTDNVVLTLGRNDVSLSAPAVTRNQIAVAGAIATRGLGDPIYNTVLVQNAQGARTAYDQLSGEIHASLTSDLLDGNRRVRSAVLNQGLTQVDGIGLWAQALQVYARSRNQAGLAKLATNRTGAIGGVAYGTGGIRFGIHGGYFDEDVRVSARLSSATVKTKLAGANLSWTPASALSVQVGGTYAWHDIDTVRGIDVSGIAGTYRSNSKAHSSQLFGEASYTLIDGPLRLAPFVRYARDMTGADALVETGGAAALAVGRDDRDLDSISAGFRFGGVAPVTPGLSVEPRIAVAYAHSWGDLAGTRSAVLGTSGAASAINGVQLGADTLDVDIGIDLVTQGGLRFGIGGFGSVSKAWGDHGAKASVSLRF
jgi:autotransporter-associated beta strand protein